MKLLRIIKRELDNIYIYRTKGKMRRSLSMLLASIVVFVTVYQMILPALTLELNDAQQTPGIYLETGDLSEEVYSEDTSSTTEDTSDIWEEQDKEASYLEEASLPEETGLTDESDTAYSMTDDEPWAEEEITDTADNPGEDQVEFFDDAITPLGSDGEIAFDDENGEYTYDGNELTAECGTDIVRLNYNAKAHIPDGSALTATRLWDEEAALLAASAEQAILGIYPDRILQQTAFYKLSITGPEGETIYPTGQIGVTILFGEVIPTDMPIAASYGIDNVAVLSTIDMIEKADGGVSKITFTCDRFEVVGMAATAEAEQKVEAAAETEQNIEASAGADQKVDTAAETLRQIETAAEEGQDVEAAVEYNVENNIDNSTQVKQEADEIAELIANAMSDSAQSEQQDETEGAETVETTEDESGTDMAEEETAEEKPSETAEDESSESAEEASDESAEDESDETSEENSGEEAEEESAANNDSSATPSSGTTNTANTGTTVRPSASADFILTVPGQPYSLHISYDETAGIPEGAEFVATPLEDENYASQALEMVNNETLTGRANLIGLFDLTVYLDGKVIAPTGPVKIEAVFEHSLEGNEEIYAVHFPGTGEQPQPEEDYEESEQNAYEASDEFIDTTFIETAGEETEEIIEEISGEWIDVAAVGAVLNEGFETTGNLATDAASDDLSEADFFTSEDVPAVYDSTSESTPAEEIDTVDAEAVEIAATETVEAATAETVEAAAAETVEATAAEAVEETATEAVEVAVEEAAEEAVEVAAEEAAEEAVKESAEEPAEETPSAVLTEEIDCTPELLPVKVEGNAAAFETERFSYFAIVGTVIETTVITAEGETYKITVTFDETSEIPAGSYLEAEEIVEDDDRYDAHAVGTADAIGSTTEQLTHLRMFDIRILSANGEKIEPASPVQVKIEYVDPASIDTQQAVQVVHFGEAGTDVIDPQTNRDEDGNLDEISFEAESFSIYSVVSSGATTDLAGKSFALISAANNSAVQGTAQGTDRLKGEAVTFASENGKDYVKANDDITFWTFENAGSGRYYIRSSDGKYLQINGRTNSTNGRSVTLSNTPQALTVTAGTGRRAGTIRISNSNGCSIDYDNGSFRSYNTNGDNDYFKLYDMMTLNPEYTAEKISVQDLEHDKKVVIYKTVYNDTTEAYEDYVIDGNGNLVKAYDKGDKVVGRSEVSPIWTLHVHYDETTGEPNGYYDFYNEETGMYLSPRGEGSLVSATKPGVTLNGRRDGDYISTIEAWDTEHWAWYGMQVLTDGNISLAPGTGENSHKFSFAEIATPQADQLHTVDTVDSAAAGITIKMYNFGSREEITNIVGGNTYKVGNYYNNSGLASRVLGSDGFPYFAGTGKSGAQLFTTGTYKGNANHLFLESVYDSTGYYEYSAFNNFAHYDQSSGNFTVYQEIGTPNNGNSFFYQRGNFLPFNNLDPTKRATNTNQYDGSGNPLEIEDPTNEGRLYLVSSVDYFFGMTMEFTFMQPKNGYNNGSPMVYEFNGDDDLWVYIDGVKVLDIGGVHDALPGTINFATGEITYAENADLISEDVLPRTIRACFKKAGVFPDGTAWDESRADEYFKGNTFVDYGSHSFNMFYMEHGKGASNLEMRFNLPVIEKGKFTVEKKLEGTNQQKFSNVYFAYQAFSKDEAGHDVPLTQAVYEGTTDPVTFYDNVEINGKTYNNVFYLKPNEAATFAEMDERTGYYVQELGVGSDYYDEIIINDVEVEGTDVTAVDGIYPTSVSTVANRARVTYQNRCSEKNKNELRITKKIEEGSVYDGATFEFRVQIENNNGVLAPYSTGEYYIHNEDGDYFRYVNGKLVNNGKTPVVASVAGNNGTIAGIPVGYTVVIRDLLAGTDFHVEEIRIPSPWELAGKEVREGTCDASTLTGKAFDNVTTITADGQIRLDTDAEEIFTNKRRTTSVNVRKVLVDPLTGNAAKDFSFTAGATFDGSAVDLSDDASFEVTSGTDGYTITGVPIGAELVITEVDGETKVGGYTTTASNTGNNGTYDNSSRSYTVTVPADGDTITFTNTRIVKKLRIKKVGDDAEEGLAGAEFSLAAEGTVDGFANLTGLTSGTAGSVVYTTGEGSAQTTTDTFILPVGTYKFTETKAPDFYEGLTAPVTLFVSKDGITLQTEDAKVGLTAETGETYDALLTVTNIRKQAKVTIIKLVEGTAADKEAQYTFTSAGLAGETENFKLQGQAGDSTEESNSDSQDSAAARNTRVYAQIPYGTVFIFTEEESADFSTAIQAEYIDADGNTQTITLDPERTNLLSTGEITVMGDTTVTYTNSRNQQSLRFRKVDMANQDQGLKDAEFTITIGDEEYKLKSDDEGYMYYEKGEEKQYVFSFPALSGTEYYTMGEDKAPAGYNNLESDVRLFVHSANSENPVSACTMPESGTATYFNVVKETIEGQTVYTVIIPNTSGVTLPDTGGPGTTLYYLLGSIMLFMAAAMLTLKGARRVLG